MYARHRSGNAYRSSSMGMGGVAAASRTSQEGSFRGHGSYNYEYRNYNRGGGGGGGGYGRGQSRQFQQSQPPPPPPLQRKGDIFMEAGRLAAEYLVAKGVLPPNALSGKLQNGSLKNQTEEFQGFRSQEDGTQISGEGSRTSALSRLRNPAADVRGVRTRYPDDYNSRSYMRGRRRTGSFKSYGSEWNREFGRSGSWSDRARASPDAESVGDASSGHQDDHKIAKEGESGSQNSLPSETNPERDSAGDAGGESESVSEKCKSVDNVGAKATSCNGENDIDSTEKSDNINILGVAETEKFKDVKNKDVVEQQNVKQDIAVEPSAEENNQTINNSSDLVMLCRFVNVPTRTRSSLANRGNKVVSDLLAEDENSNKSGFPEETGGHVEHIPDDISASKISSGQSGPSTGIDENGLKAKITEQEPGTENAVGEGRCTRSLSFPQFSSAKEPESNEGLTGFGRSSSMPAERGEKRSVDDCDREDANKKPREWFPLADIKSDGFKFLSDPMENQQITQSSRSSHDEEALLAPEGKRFTDIPMFPEGDMDPNTGYTKEKLLFPGSFKTCDLNLMEASEVNEHHEADPILMFPAITESGKQEATVSIDLSMSNNCNLSDKYGRTGVDGKDIEVIDLESDSLQDNKDFNISERREDTVFTDLDGFPNNTNNANGIHDIQDGYGLMISDLLGNDITNCSSVPGVMNSLPGDMSLHNEEGILGDDDPIYMSLGEIPISFLRGWEQPSQDYGKPF